MKEKKKLVDLSRAEYDILRTLWNAGQLSVREVHDLLTETYNWAYTTTKTMMDRMVNKELLNRESFHGVFIYKPLITRPAGLARMVQFFADRVLEMDVGSVVSLFARSKSLTPEEIDELNNLLVEKKDGKK
ncbi:BlaI/MecI/CopY family transcriptional regulator [candidate division KSB1 bacterium]|nr:BlaI/MecI/CopY family transcriptional regulator [candidate division KSB1 bacterium]MBL7093654.1 BlaI/MecI/CopY family transcriptional regulator [candidate division KSB1 bacterium]